ncbi:MAG TPA: YihY/virulence factor BrkB family protein [Fastidiosipila sp.]|nr:YihY/virulence factor BrkB family protein [Fastidiosipila sp.]
MKKKLVTVKNTFHLRKEQVKSTKIGAYIHQFISSCRKADVFQKAAQLAYHLMFAFFPLLIFLLSVLSFTTFNQEETLAQILQVLPFGARELIRTILLDVVKSRSATLLSVSIVLALWSGSNGLRHLIVATEKAFHVNAGKRNFFITRGLAILSTLVFVALILLTLTSQVFGKVLFNAIAPYAANIAGFETIWLILFDLIPILFVVLALASFYHLLPHFPKGKRIPFRYAFVGGLFAGLGWLLVSYGFQLYVNRFANYANTYGSLGGVIVLMIWLYLTSLMILLGAHVAATAFFLRQKGGELSTSQKADSLVK